MPPTTATRTEKVEAATRILIQEGEFTRSITYVGKPNLYTSLAQLIRNSISENNDNTKAQDFDALISIIASTITDDLSKREEGKKAIALIQKIRIYLFGN